MQQLSKNLIEKGLRKETSLSKEVLGVAVDTRLLKPNQLFFALAGERVDGHDFLEQAAKKGAAAAVVHASYSGPDYSLPLIRVEEGLKALHSLTRVLIEACPTCFIAVTGSLGKTTTKGFLTTLLETQFRTASTPKNYNSQIGLPLAILNCPIDQPELFVLEMGMTGPGEISTLVDLTCPEIALLTTVDAVHIGNFNSIEQIAEAKGEIFDHLHTRLGFLPSDVVRYERLSKRGSCVKNTFGVDQERATFSLSCRDGVLFMREKEEPPYCLGKFPVLGKHNLHNLAGALAVARSLGVSWEKIKGAVPLLSLPEKRLQLTEKHGVVFLNDSYNACESSMKAALDTLPNPKNGGKTVAVLGGMVEMGKFSTDCHRSVGEYSLQKADRLLCFGPECAPLHAVWKEAKRPVTWCQSYEELLTTLQKEAIPGDVILLKGSCNKQLWKLLDDFTPH